MQKIQLTANALTVLDKRYLLKDHTGKTIETPEQLFQRVAQAAAQRESQGKTRKFWFNRFLEIMSNLRFLPNSPTLMNAGKKNGQLSACFVLPIEDSLESIFDTLKYAAKIHQSGGGTGFSFSHLRPQGSIVQSSKGVASGPVSFMRIFDVATETIKQGGTRRGANMAILRVDHPDILEFIECKLDQKSITNFNISVGVTNEFMDAVRSGSEFWLKDHLRTPVKKVIAKEIFDRIVSAAWASGDPGMVFLDQINLFNPTPKLGPMESTNPCITGKTRIHTEKEGLVPIQELVGKTLRIATEVENKTEFLLTSQIFSTGVKPVFRLRTNEGYEIVLTGDHLITTARGDIRADQLQTGDRIRMMEIDPPGVDWDSQDAAIGEAIGWLARDGQTTNPGDEISIPEAIWRGSPDIQAGYLRALFSSEASVQGSITQEFNIRFTSIRFELLQNIQLLLLNFGIKSVIDQNRRNEPIHELTISKSSLTHFARKIGFFISKKQNLLESNLSRLPQDLSRESFYATFKELVFEGEEEVFDLTQPETEHFHANGILVHNCAEQPLLPFESCNLGSLNLGLYFKKNQFDWSLFRQDIETAIRFLDNIIDVNTYPVPQCEKITLKNRKIGLGVMGFADLLLMMGIPYASEEAIQWGEKIMGFLNEEAKKVSAKLAKKRGPFPNWKGSLWDKKGYPPLRNATVSTVAPTGTISIIAGASSGIEPLFSGVFYRNVLDGERLVEVHPAVEKILKQRGISSHDLSDEKIAKEIGPAWSPSRNVPVEFHVKMQAAFQKHSDSGVSKTINLPENTTVSDVAKAYELAYQLGCKGITIYRDKSKPTQVLEHAEKIDEGEPEICPSC